MEVANTSEDKKFEWKRIGCCMKFKHETRCTGIKRNVQQFLQGFHAKEGNHYHCKTCGRQYSYHSGVNHQIRIGCLQKKEKKNFIPAVFSVIRKLTQTIFLFYLSFIKIK